MRIKISLSIALLSLTLAGTAALADPPKKKPAYPPPEQSSTVGVLGAHHDNSAGHSGSREPAAPSAAPAVPKVEAEPPAPVAAPEHFEVHPDQGEEGSATTGAPMMAAPMGPPPSGFLPDHPFISGLMAGLIGSDLGSKLYGGPIMGDENGAVIGYVARIGGILLLAFLLFRAIGRRAMGGGEEPKTLPRRREPSFKKAEPASQDGRREPTF